VALAGNVAQKIGQRITAKTQNPDTSVTKDDKQPAGEFPGQTIRSAMASAIRISTAKTFGTTGTGVLTPGAWSGYTKEQSPE